MEKDYGIKFCCSVWGMVSFDSPNTNMVLVQCDYYHIIKNFWFLILFKISLRFPILRKILRGIANSEDPIEILMSILEGKKPSKKKNKKKKKKKEKSNENENESNEEEPEPEENSGSGEPEKESVE